MPDANTGGVVPPEGTKDYTLHILVRRDGSLCEARWNDDPFGKHWTIGRRSLTQPSVLARAGWTYVGPVEPPAEHAP